MNPLGALAIAMVLSLSALEARAGEYACVPAPEPVVALSYDSRYTDNDANRATIDPLREAEAEAAVAPLDDFIVQLAEEVDAMYSSPVGMRTPMANCILSQLSTWAEADALVELDTVTVQLTVGSRYAAFALILWQTLPYAHDHPDRYRILGWLDRRMHEQMVFWENAAEGARQGNLRAWAGLAAASLSAQTGDAELRDWAEIAVMDVMCSAAPDGSLPREMVRGRFALHYQLHATAPLVTAAALLERQGVPASRACDGALHRIVGFGMSDLDNGLKTKAITGETQNFFDGTDTLQKFQLAWIEPYLALQHDEDIAAMADDLGTLSYSKLGGNQTALWGD